MDLDDGSMIFHLREKIKLFMKNILKVHLVAFLLLMTSFTACRNGKAEDSADAKTAIEVYKIPDTLKWSERMALSIMERNPEAWQIDENEQPEWDYVHGLVLKAFLELYEETGEEKYYDYVKDYADELIDETGAISTYDIEDYNIDMINAGKILFPLYERTGNEKYLKAMQTLRKQLEEQPRTKAGGFWHKKRYPNQMWLDGLYMGAPFYARYTTEFENGKKLDDVAEQFELIQKNARDEETGLLYHGWDEGRKMEWADDQTGTSPNFWSRSLGWYAMALVDVLDYFPQEHEKRDDLIGYLNQLADAVVKVQDESGLWYQVPNMPGREGNYLEASGSAMLAYALAKGVNKGYLPEKYMDDARQAFDGLTQKLIKVDEEGKVTITNVNAVAGLGGDPYRDGSYEYYINERKNDNDPKATGPFILGALQLDK